MILIQMCMTIATHGQYFLANHQYEASGTVNTAIDISLPRLKNNGVVAPHYTVPINGTTYNVPACTCAEVFKEIPIAKQNHARAFEQEITDKTENWQKTWKDLTGVQVNNGAGADMDLRQYNKLKPLIEKSEQ